MRDVRALQRFPTVAAIAVAVAGTLVLVGWSLDVAVLKRVLPSLPAMKANTAVALIVLGAAMALVREGQSPARQRTGRFLGGVLAIFGAIVLGEYLFGGIGVDELLFSDPAATRGRPATLTALVLTALGLSLLYIDAGGRRQRISDGGWMLGLALTVAAIVGYAGDVTYLSGSRGVAVHTALALLVASVGVAATRPRRGVVHWLSRSDPGATMARRILPVAIAAPVLLSLLARAGQAAGLFGAPGALVLAALMTLALTLAVIAHTARLLQRVEHDRRAASTLAETLIQSLGVGIAACDERGRLTYFNAELQRIHGLETADVDSARMAQYSGVSAFPSDAPMTSDEPPLVRALRGESVRDVEQVVLPVGQAPRHVRLNAEPLRDVDGSSLGAVIGVRDETELRNAEAIRRRLASIVESSNDAIASQDLGGTITTWNAGAERLYGYSEAEALGADALIVVPSDREAELEDVMRRTAGAERVNALETVRRHKDGSLLDVVISVSPSFDADHRIVGAAVIARDLSERRRADRTFAQLMEMAPDAVIGVGDDGRIRVANSRVQAMFGYDEHELIGKPIEVLVPDAFRTAHTGQRAGYLREPSVRTMGAGLALFARRRDGDQFACEISLAPVDTDQGPMATAMVRDVSDRKRIEEESDRLKSEFFGLVSHELRTPLTSIVGYADLLAEEEGTRLSETGRRHLAIVKRNSERLDLLVQDLLLVGQVDAGTFSIHPGPVDIQAAARECVEQSAPAAAAAQVALRLDCAPVRRFVGDHHRLTQVLDNLISNGLKFTPAGGRVDVLVHELAGMCAIEVRDTGAGIDPDEREHLFDRFYRGARANATYVKGIGLGLPITAAIVSGHGGRIEVESEPGDGALFRVLLPMPPVEAEGTDGRRPTARTHHQ